MQLSTAHTRPARGIRAPRRVDARAVAGGLILLVATGGAIAFWSAQSDTQAVLTATRDLPGGATLSEADLTVSHVRVDDSVYRAAIPADALPQLLGKQLAEPVHAQQLLVPAQLSSRPLLGPGQLAMTIPVKPETAAGGRIRPGDAVAVLWTTSKDRANSLTSVILPRVTVYDVAHDDRLTVVNTGGAADSMSQTAAQGPIASVTLVVSTEQALTLAQAKWNGELDVALLPPDHS